MTGWSKDVGRLVVLGLGVIRHYNLSPSCTQKGGTFLMKRSHLVILLVVLIALCMVVTPAMAKKKKKRKKKGAEEPPPVGEVVVGKWTCYSPPDFAGLSHGKRRTARGAALDYLQRLVTGKVMEGFAIEGDENLTYFETAFLGRPSLVDTWMSENYRRCLDVAQGKTKPSAYQAYLSDIGREFEKGQCYKPLDYEYHNYMDIQSGWQFRIHVCAGDKILIETTGEENGKYTIEDTGKVKENKYITSLGDPEVPEAGDKGMVADQTLGAVVLRFEEEDGSYTKYQPTGYALRWEAPAHGFISFTVNDLTYFNNAFHDGRSGIDFLGLDIYPAVAEGGTLNEGLTP